MNSSSSSSRSSRGNICTGCPSPPLPFGKCVCREDLGKVPYEGEVEGVPGGAYFTSLVSVIYPCCALVFLNMINGYHSFAPTRYQRIETHSRLCQESLTNSTLVGMFKISSPEELSQDVRRWWWTLFFSSFVCEAQHPVSIIYSLPPPTAK